MYNEDDKLEYVECTCTILAVRRKRRVAVRIATVGIRGSRTKAPVAIS